MKAMSMYIVDNEKLFNYGRDDKNIFFTKQKGVQNIVVLVPWSFDGVIYPCTT